jgi:hypothetical protein
MRTGRRIFISNVVVTLGVANFLRAAGRQQGVPPSFPGELPDASNSKRPADPSSLPPMASPKEQLKQSQKTLRRDADHLLDLAKELKDEIDKTEQTDVLSLSLVRKAEEIEKLAKQIKDLIRAA